MGVEVLLGQGGTGLDTQGCAGELVGVGGGGEGEGFGGGGGFGWPGRHRT